MTLDLTSERIVFGATLDGEAASGGQTDMENVAQVILNRRDTGWESSVLRVCLAHAQFSCWTPGPDLRRVEADAASNNPTWQLALRVADAALAGQNPDRVCDADSYFAHSVPRPPYWAVPPATHVYSDASASFWRVRSRSAAPASATPTTDDLNAASAAGTLQIGSAP